MPQAPTWRRGTCWPTSAASNWRWPPKPRAPCSAARKPCEKLKELIMRSPRQRNAVRLILDEHKQLSAVIQGMLCFVRLIDKGEKAPGLMVFRAMLYYIREYPEQVHHPKEDQYLFARLRDRTSELDETLAELESQHTQGEALVRELEHALTRYELEGSSAFLAFRDLVEKYAKFYFSHMR